MKLNRKQIIFRRRELGQHHGSIRPSSAAKTRLSNTSSAIGPLRQHLVVDLFLLRYHHRRRRRQHRNHASGHAARRRLRARPIPPKPPRARLPTCLVPCSRRQHHDIRLLEIRTRSERAQVRHNVEVMGAYGVLTVAQRTGAREDVVAHLPHPNVASRGGPRSREETIRAGEDGEGAHGQECAGVQQRQVWTTPI